MRTPSRSQKFFSAVFSIALVGGFLSCTRSVFLMSGTKSNSTFSFVGSSVRPPAPAPTVPTIPASDDKPPEFMGGSKSTFIFKGNSIRPPGWEPAKTVPPIPLAE